MTKTTDPTIYTSQGEAEDAAEHFNRARTPAHPWATRPTSDLRVVVEGPGDGSWWNFDLREAIDNGFSYSWSAA